MSIRWWCSRFCSLWSETYLIAGLCVEQNPSELDHFGRIFGDINAMLIAGGGHMDDDIAVELGNGRSSGGHIGSNCKVSSSG